MRHAFNFFLITCFLTISSCAVFPKKYEYKEIPKVQKIDVLYVSMSRQYYSKGKLSEEIDVIENPSRREEKIYAKELKEMFENHPLINEIHIVPSTYTTDAPMLTIKSIHQEKSISSRLLIMVWLGVSAASFSIIPFWLNKNIKLKVKTQNVPVEHEFWVKRKYKEAAWFFMLPRMLSKNPEDEKRKLEESIVNEIITKSFQPDLIK